MALGVPVVPDVQVTNATSGSWRIGSASVEMPRSSSSAAGRTVSSTWSTSAWGERSFTGTNTAPASQMPAIVVTRSGPLGRRTATPCPGSTPAARSFSAPARAAARASPALRTASMVHSRSRPSAKGWSMRRLPRFSTLYIQYPVVDIRPRCGPDGEMGGSTSGRPRLGRGRAVHRPPALRPQARDATLDSEYLDVAGTKLSAGDVMTAGDRFGGVLDGSSGRPSTTASPRCSRTQRRRSSPGPAPCAPAVSPFLSIPLTRAPTSPTSSRTPVPA